MPIEDRDLEPTDRIDEQRRVGGAEAASNAPLSPVPSNAIAIAMNAKWWPWATA